MPMKSFYLILLAACLLADMAHATALQAPQSVEMLASAHLMRSEGTSAPHHAHHNAAAHDPVAHGTISDADHGTAEKGKLKIELYYESRCPDCVLFINNSLAPLWRNKELNPHIELTMNPYGNAMTVPMSQISEGYKFWHPERRTGWDFVHICQHGGEECFGNTIQACAISKLPQEKHMDLILCMESLPEWGIEKASYECMEKLSIDKNKIKECASGPEGNKILAEFGKQTNNVPGRQGTPWLMINGNHLENPNNLLKSVCAHVGSESSSCKPFAHEQGSQKKKKEDSDDGDEFQVLGKINNVDKNLVIMSPPKRI